ELMLPAGHFSRADFPDNPSPKRVEIFLLNARRAREQLGYGKIDIPLEFNGVPKREKDSDPIEDVRSLLNLNSTTFPPISVDDPATPFDDGDLTTLKKLLAQIHY